MPWGHMVPLWTNASVDPQFRPMLIRPKDWL
jgi:hypothetical protein